MEGTAPLPYQNNTQITYPAYDEAETEWNAGGEKVAGMIGFIAPLPQWEKEKTFCLALPLPDNQPKTNLVIDQHTVMLRDVRGREEQYDLDTHGFTFAAMPPLKVDLDDEQALRTDYVQQMEDFLREKLQADIVHVFDYTLRRVKPQGASYNWNEARPPGTSAHVDQSPHAAFTRMRLHLEGNIETLKTGRVQLINIWRPIVGPVKDMVLGICDARTVENEDLITHDLVYHHYVGENLQLKYNSKQRWYFLDNMEPGEGIIFKNFDSIMDGRARLAPHAAFKRLGEVPANSPLRQSIEIRAIVYHATNDDPESQSC
ncbi:hypothetical protein QBC40DRAFT_253766 [Triangularia verruculosa]|uniref:Methyltransferase n=1 Tax=Triangularia verruculosa TaxID=2587418 RepID=A0AAN6XJJ3_9PEZI|nr:hypothetical protein QBC40DRAFT_253766 [Triangularia verruculosa]